MDRKWGTNLVSGLVMSGLLLSTVVGAGAQTEEFTEAPIEMVEAPPAEGEMPMVEEMPSEAMPSEAIVEQAPVPAAPIETAAPAPAPVVTAPAPAVTAPAPVVAAPAPKPLNWTPRAKGQFIYGALTANSGATATLAKDAGFTHMWGYVPWSNVEPSRGRFVFKEQDEWGQTKANDLTNVVKAAKDAGLKFVLRIDAVPAWAGGDWNKLNPADLEKYVKEAVTYAKGTVAIVEVGNEPNIPAPTGIGLSPEAYVPLLKAAFNGVKAADPSVKVVAAAVAPRTGGKGGAGGVYEDVEWLDRFYKAGGKPYFDYMGMHPYIGNFAPETEPTCVPMCFRTLELWRAVMEQNGDTKSAFITEVGTIEAGPNNLGPYEWMKLPADKRADYLVKAVQLANANYPWLAGVMVFNLDYATTAWTPASSEHHWFSLLNANKSPRQAYNAFKQARGNGTLS